VLYVDYFPMHYRIGLYEELARRMEVDFVFFSDERERWHNPMIKATDSGEYRRLPLRRVSLAGHHATPGIVRAIAPDRYDAVIKGLNGRVMLPLTYLTA
jgi:hypothetical protein